MQMFGIVRDKDNKPKIDDPALLNAAQKAQLTAEERAELGIEITDEDLQTLMSMNFGGSDPASEVKKSVAILDLRIEKAQAQLDRYNKRRDELMAQLATEG